MQSLRQAQASSPVRPRSRRFRPALLRRARTPPRAPAIRRANASSLHLAEFTTERCPQFHHAEPDACLDGPEWFAESPGGVHVSESFVKCELDRRALRFR